MTSSAILRLTVTTHISAANPFAGDSVTPFPVKGACQKHANRSEWGRVP